jgi:prepilin-type N-terminal cleavage/methylation domain-containing protein
MSGFSLLEVMIALTLISFGLMHLLLQQLQWTSALEEIYFKTHAMHQAISLRERLRANQSSAFRLREIQTWQHENTQLFARGVSVVSYHSGHYEIIITWRQRLDQCLKITLPI